MTLRTISRTAVGASLKLARLPVDGVLRVAGGAPANGVKLILDRAEARIRALAVKALGDEVLQEDARRRRLAADERERAMHLRAEAELRSERADEQVASKERAAERRRGRAAESAKRQRRQAEERRESRKRQAAQATHRRRDAAEKSADQSGAAGASRHQGGGCGGKGGCAEGGGRSPTPAGRGFRREGRAQGRLTDIK